MRRNDNNRDHLTTNDATVHAANPDRLMTIGEVAEYLQVPKAALYRWRTEGTGPRGAKVGKHVRYRRSIVDAWIDEQYEAA